VNEGDFVVAMTGATTGKVGIHTTKEKILLNQRVGKFTKFNNKVVPQYVYYYIRNNSTLFMDLAAGTARDNISPDQILSVQIPLPSLERQQQIVESIDGFTQLAHHEEQALKMLEKQVMFFVKEMGRGQPRVKLGDVCEIKYGDKNKFHETTELYPGIGGGVAPSSYVTNWNIDAYTPIVSRSGSAGHISRYPTRASAGSFAFVCITNNNIVNNDYLYFVLKNDEEYIKTLPEGTVQKNMNRDVLRGVDIQLPPLAEQQTLQSDFEEIRHKHAKIAEYKKKAQDAIKRLIPGA
jgi:type I restriction enzyme S subunit